MTSDRRLHRQSARHCSLDQAGLVAELEDLLGAHVDVVSDRALKDRDAAIRAEAVPL
jgi:predicted nucleotidyltransferase